MRLGRFRLDLDLWIRGWIAIQPLLLAAIILVGHKCFRLGLKFLFAEEFVGIQKLIDVVEQVAIISLTTWLLVEAVRIFLPPPWGLILDLDESSTTRTKSGEPSSDS